MNNQWDIGMQQDWDNMTEELGREVLVYPRADELNYEGQEDTSSGLDTGTIEVVFLQEIDTEHEMVQSGQMNIGDVKLTFKSDTLAEEEGYVSPDEGVTMYKILKLTVVKNQSNDVIVYVKAFGKKVPNR